MIKIERLCDECGEPASELVALQTSHFYKDNEYLGQTADFCEKHFKDEDRTHIKINLPES